MKFSKFRNKTVFDDSSAMCEKLETAFEIKTYVRTRNFLEVLISTRGVIKLRIITKKFAVDSEKLSFAKSFLWPLVFTETTRQHWT